jgi:hypothetical protein
VDGEAALPVVQSELAREAIPAYQALEGLSRPSEYRARYADEIYYADASIGRLVEAFEAHDPDPVMLLTSDHGESLGEDGRYFMHGFATTPQLAHVPMILVASGLPPARRGDLVHHVDVMPTLLELAGLDVPEGAKGLALAPSLRAGRALPLRTVYCDIGSEVSAYRDDSVLRALGVLGAWAPGADPERVRPIWHSYTWRADGSWERVPEVDVPTEEVRHYLGRAFPLVRSEVEPERVEELRALGYVVDGHEARPGPAESRKAPNAERR